MMDRRPSHVLVCLRYGIGDLVMELPAIDALRQSMPEAILTALGAEPAIEILAGDGRFDEIVSIQRWGIRHLGDATDAAVRQRFADWLASHQFDLIFDPSHAANDLRPIMNRQQATIKDAYTAYLNEGLAQGLNGLAAVKYGACLGWGLTVPTSSYPAVRLSEGEIDWARRFLEERGMRDSLGMSPGASGDLKRWPVEHFTRLCRRVRGELNASVLLFGGPAETDVLRVLVDQTKDLNDITAVEGLHLRRVAALLSQCRVYVGNDSGLMHLAAAVGTPVVVLFGPTVPQTYLPTWVCSYAVTSPIACAYRPQQAFGHPPCVQEGTCFPGTPCIQAIDPADAYTAVRQEYATAATRKVRS
jgi:ADP-heptose:LPS heptosyltransferase